MEFCTTMKKNKIALYYRVERYPGYIIKWKKKKASYKTVCHYGRTKTTITTTKYIYVCKRKSGKIPSTVNC